MNTPINVSAMNLAAAAQLLLPTPKLPLNEAVAQFLLAKAPLVVKRYLMMLEYSLRDLVAGFGTLPIDMIKAGMIQQSMSLRKLEAYTQSIVLRAILSFFHWARSQGHLAPGLPTAADLITLHVPFKPLGIIRPCSLERVIFGANDVELRVAIALWSFAGISCQESMRWNWENFRRGQTILCASAEAKSFGRALRIRPVLDSWVRPFYGSTGPVISSGERGGLRALARKLRVTCHPRIPNRSYVAYALALSGKGSGSVTGSGIPLSRVPTRAEAQEFFSLTPERVGITNWPQRVTEYLAKRPATHRRRGHRSALAEPGT